MSELRTAIYYRYLAALKASSAEKLEGRDANTKTTPVVAIPCPPAKPAGTAETALKPTGTDKQGVAFTNLGPAAYTGDILEDPELLWTEDVWSEEREEEARSKLSQQGDAVPAYWKTQYESKAGSYWHKFYKRNADHFYKDRHYLHIVFPELLHGAAPPTGDGTAPPAVVESNPQYLLEVGCGVGNAVLPLVELNSNLHIVAMDFAASAIEILNRHPFVHSCVDALPSKCLDVTALGDRYLRRNSVSAASSSSGSSSGSSGGDAAVSPENANRRVRTAVRCIVKDPLPVPSASMDLALCMFVLSAISPAEQLVALGKIAAVLKPGGKLLVRDYGRYDEAQLRFKKGSKLGENFYVRQDGTCSYFFDLTELQAACAQVGLVLEESHYVRRQYANRQQKEARRRVWIHAKFVKAA